MKLNRTITAYLILAGVVFLFDKIYSVFAHGVKSAWMSNAYLYLICFGMLFLFLKFFVPYIINIKDYRLFYNIYNSGVAILINGMLIKGVLDIAGTDSVLIYPYLIASAAFIAAAAVLFVRLLFVKRGRH